MKKIFTIMLAAGATISFASAQSNRSIAFNDHKKMIGYDQHAAFRKISNVAYKDANFSYRQKEAKLEKINREFDQKIVFVKNDRHLKGREKVRQIQLLQNQRKNEISRVEFQYAASNHKADSKIFGRDSHKW